MTRVRRHLPLLACALLGCILLALFAPGGLLRESDPPPELPRRSPYDLTVFIDETQEYLSRHPDDSQTWAGLGNAYLEQARRTTDVTYYGKAQQAFQRSLDLSATVGEPGVDAVIGMGALANARHDFAGGLRWGERARKVAPYRWPLYGVLTDAYTELGRYGQARTSVQRMLDGEPDLASFTRAAHLDNLYGQTARAREALHRARETAQAPAEYAFCLWQLGELAFNGGDPRGALDLYTQALDADPTHAPSLAGKARAEAALGRTADALHDYATAVARAPSFAVEYGELREYLGDRIGARRQYAVFVTQMKLLAANGVTDDLAIGRFQADHGDPVSAVRHLRAEWKRRHSIDVADALGWALHRTGRHAEAAKYASYAGRLGGRNALFAYHRGEIDRALGRTATARAHLAEALSINPYFSLAGAARAREELA